MSQESLVLIKPDAVERNIIGKVLTEYERNGLVVKEMKLLTADKATAEKHYADHREKPFFGELVTYITSGPLVALIIEGENAIERVRAINGSTKPEEAADNTIRKLYGVDLQANTVHASDSPENAEKEKAIWFN